MVFAPLQIDARVAMDSRLTEAVHDVISNVIVHVLTVIGFILAPITFHESICVNRKKNNNNIFSTGHCSRPNVCECNKGYNLDPNDPFRQVSHRRQTEKKKTLMSLLQ